MWEEANFGQDNNGIAIISIGLSATSVLHSAKHPIYFYSIHKNPIHTISDCIMQCDTYIYIMCVYSVSLCALNEWILLSSGSTFSHNTNYNDYFSENERTISTFDWLQHKMAKSNIQDSFAYHLTIDAIHRCCGIIWNVYFSVWYRLFACVAVYTGIGCQLARIVINLAVPCVPSTGHPLIIILFAKCSAHTLNGGLVEFWRLHRFVCSLVHVVVVVADFGI